MAIGDRGHPDSRTLVAARSVRALGSRAINRLTYAVLLGSYRDTQCGLKGFRSDVGRFVFAQARVDGFAFDIEVLHLVERHQLSLVEVPVEVANSGRSTVRAAREAFRLVADLFRIRHWAAEGRYEGGDVPPPGAPRASRPSFIRGPPADLSSVVAPCRISTRSSRPTTCGAWPRPARRRAVRAHRCGVRPLRPRRRRHRRRPGAHAGHRGPRHAAHRGRAGRRLRRGGAAPGARRGRPRPGLHRPDVLRLGPPRRARRDVHRLAQPGPVQRHQDVPGRRQAHRGGHRARPTSRRWRRWASSRRPPPPAGIEARDLLGAFADHVRSFVDVSVPAAHEGRGRHRQRHGWPGRARGVRRAAGRARRALRRARRHVPQPPGRPDPAREPARPAGPGAARPGADIGLAFDGDADRVFLVDDQGEPLSGSITTAIVAKGVLEKDPGATILYNLICSHAVPEVIAENGGTPVRTRVGHSFIKAVMAETGAAFGGEHSAHYYFRDNFRADSGSIAALVVLEQIARRACRCPSCASRSTATRRPARSTRWSTTPGGHRAGGGRRPTTWPGARSTASTASPSSGRLVVQPATLQHRAAAAAQPRSSRPCHLRRPRRRGARPHHGG